MPKLFRITTIHLALKYLLTGQMKYMSQNGFNVTMISAGSKKDIITLVEQEKCLHLKIPMTRTITPFHDIKCLFKLIKLIKEEKPDIVHTHTPKAGLLGMLAAKIAGVKVKLHTVAGLPLMTSSGLKRHLLIAIEKLTYWAADVVLPNSYSILNYIKKEKFLREEKIHIIGHGSSNGIDLNRFSRDKLDISKLKKIKSDIMHSSEYTYLISIGRVVKDKGIVEIVDSFINLGKNHPNLKLLLIGPMEKVRSEEALPQRIHHIIAKNKNIIYISWSNEVEYYLYLADMLVHASYREGFPNVLLQAGAMECPVICSEIPGNIDIVTNEYTGIYFKAGDSEDLLKKLQYALQNIPLMKQYSKSLRKEIEINYSREFIQSELLKFYKKKLEIYA